MFKKEVTKLYGLIDASVFTVCSAHMCTLTMPASSKEAIYQFIISLWRASKNRTMHAYTCLSTRGKTEIKSNLKKNIVENVKRISRH